MYKHVVAEGISCYGCYGFSTLIATGIVHWLLGCRVYLTLVAASVVNWLLLSVLGCNGFSS